eukprot:12669-Pelagococcus_subviridis.AAC.2
MPALSSKPHAFPTIFCASVKPPSCDGGTDGKRKTSDFGSPRLSLARVVRPRPTMRFIRPPALTSSSRTSVFSENVHTISSVP